MKIALIIAAAGFAAVKLSAAPVDWSKLPPSSTQTGVTFDKEIAPIFKEACARCHGENRPKAQLRLDTLNGVMKGAKDGPVVKTGDSAASMLVRAISQLDPQMAMPPKPRGPRMQGTNAPAMPPQGGPGGPEAGGPPPGGPGGGPPNFGPPAKPLTAEQVGLVRAWIDQGAK